MPGRLASTSSSLYARNLFAFVETLVDKEKKALAPKWDDELVKATLLTKDGAVVHPNGSLTKGDHNNFNPRLGLAWHPLQKWVFRGGFGMYTVDIKFPAGRDMYDEYVGTAVQQANPGDPTPIYQISRGTTPPRPVFSRRYSAVTMAAYIAVALG